MCFPRRRSCVSKVALCPIKHFAQLKCLVDIKGILKHERKNKDKTSVMFLMRE